MSKKAFKKLEGHSREISLTICFLMAFSPISQRVSASELAQANQNLQAIFGRMKQKYAAHEAEQAAIAADEEVARTAAMLASPRQSIDTNTAVGASNPTYLSEDSNEFSDVDRFAVGEELILDATLNEFELASVIGIKSEKGLKIGLADFLQILSLPINVDSKALTADGWFLTESRKFSMRPGADDILLVELGDKKYTLTGDDYFVGDDLYVELEFLREWFGLNYELHEENLALALTSTQKLPIELQADRLKRKNNIFHQANSASVLPLKDSNYKLYSPPMFDFQASAQQAERVRQARPLTNTPEYKYSSNSGRYSLLASQDLAYLNSEIYLAGNDQDSLSHAWLTFSRQSDAHDLLGPLAATEYAFGDVTPIAAGIGGTGERNLGFSINNTPLDQLADNRRVNLVGEIQEGWDVELYRNGILIDQRLNINDGRYEFNDTLLEYGANDFEFIFYGPQGQIEKKKESYIVDANTVRSGELQYRFSLVDMGSSLFNVNPTLTTPDQEGILVSNVLDYGLTDWLAVNFGGSLLNARNGDNFHTATLGADLSLGAAGLINARVEQDSLDLVSSQFGYRARLWNTSYSFGVLRRELFDTYPQIPGDNLSRDKSVIDRYSASMSGRLFGGLGFPINYQNSWQRIDDTSRLGSVSDSFQNTLSISTRLGYISNGLTYQKDAYDFYLLEPTEDQPGILVPVEENSLRGQAHYRKSFGRLHTRLFGNYGIKPVNEIYAYGGAFNYSWNNNLNSELRYTEYTWSDNYQINFSTNWRRDSFRRFN